MKKVTIYTAKACTYSKLAKSFFNIRGISYTEKDVILDVKAREEMIAKAKAESVPVIEIGNEVVVGFNREKLLELIQQV